MEFLKELFAEPLSYEAFQKVLAEKGIKLADISKGEYVSRDKFDKVHSELADKKAAFDTLQSEFTRLQESNAGGEDYKAKFEQLQNEIAEKEKAAKEKQKQAEKEADILNRYNAAAVDKNGKPLEWMHDAIRIDYLHKFSEALADKANAGKSDTEIFQSLTQDDGAAFKVPTAQTVFSGADSVGGNSAVTKEAFAKMGYKDRVKLYNENKQLYDDLNGGNE